MRVQRSASRTSYFSRTRLERFLEVDALLVGDGNEDEHDVGQLEGQVLLRLAGLLRLVAVAVVQLAGQLADLLHEAGQVRERRPVALGELADVRVHRPLRLADPHGAPASARASVKRSSSSCVL
jgi:hypothetical protein